MNYILYLSQLLVSYTLAEVSKIHALLQSVHRSTQFPWYIMTGYPFISSHTLPTLLVVEPLIVINSLQIPCELHHFTTLWSSELRDGLRDPDRASLEVVIKRVWRYTWRMWSGEFGDELGGCDCANLVDMIGQGYRYTRRLWSSEFGDTLGGYDPVSLEMPLEAMKVRVWRCTGRPWSCECRDASGGRDKASLEMHLKAVIERVWRCTCRPWLMRQSNEGERDDDWLNCLSYRERRR